MKDHNNYDILIADDNPDNLKVLTEILSGEGYNVRVAKNGEQVIKSINASPVDLLILDIHMPVMDGFEVCKIIREDDTTKNIPVVFMSALTDSFNKIQAFKAGALDYLTKPVDYDELKLRVSNYLTIRELFLEVDRLKKVIEEKEAKNG